MKILIIISIVVVSLMILLVAGILKSNHAIRFADGYDSELENDYQALIAQAKEKGEKEK